MSHTPSPTEPHLTHGAQASQRRLRAWLKHWRARADGVFRRRKPQPAPKRNLNLLLRDWHKRAGLFAFLFLGWLGVSGLLLNESNSLGLDVTRVHWPWLTSMYGLKPEPPRSGFDAGGHWLASTNEATVLDGRPLATQIDNPLGLAEGGDAAHRILFVATPESLVLLTPAGERVDELRAPILPVSSVRRIGTLPSAPGSVVVQDLDAFQSRDGGDTWTPVDGTQVQWSRSVPLSDQQRASLLPYARPSVILEQMLIDLHSGRLFGRAGQLVIDTVGIAALLLATSGVWMWWRTSRRRQAARITAPAPRPAGMRTDAGA